MYIDEIITADPLLAFEYLDRDKLLAYLKRRGFAAQHFEEAVAGYEALKFIQRTLKNGEADGDR